MVGVNNSYRRGVLWVANLGTLQIHQIVANLKKHADQIYEWNVVPVVMSTNKQGSFFKERTRQC